MTECVGEIQYIMARLWDKTSHLIFSCISRLDPIGFRLLFIQNLKVFIYNGCRVSVKLKTSQLTIFRKLKYV